MEVIIQKTPELASQVAAQRVARLIQQKPNAILGLATGATPLKLYAELIQMHKKGSLDFAQTQSFNLDEYVGLGPEHPASYRYYMREHFFKHINIKLENTHIPSGLAKDIPSECAAYEAQIKQRGGIDLQILGIGGDGHIGFNEPTSSLSSRTRIKTLTERTRKDNTQYFKAGEEVPYHVITMGIGTIMEAKNCLLLAFGENKAQAVADMVEGPLSSMVPASALQWHQKATVIVDEAAASKLKRRDYYQWVYDHRPQWQR